MASASSGVAFSSSLLARSGLLDAAVLQVEQLVGAPPAALLLLVVEIVVPEKRGGAGEASGVKGLPRPLVSLSLVVVFRSSLLLGPSFSLLSLLLLLLLQGSPRRGGPARDVPELYRRGRALGGPGEPLPLPLLLLLRRRGGRRGRRGGAGEVGHFSPLFF